MTQHADPLDMAAEYADCHNNEALQAHRERQNAIEPETDCQECGDPIPEARRQAIRTNLCVDCAEHQEQRRDG